MFKDLGQDPHVADASGSDELNAAERTPLSNAPTSLRFTHAMKDIGKRASEADALQKELSAAKAELRSASRVLEIDPALIDPSPIRDRMESDPADEQSLRGSILEMGQQIPVLLRPSEKEGGRYVTVFGHRRVAALRALDRKVKAIVANINEHDALVVQGVENAERRDLTFIEKARFAKRLSEAGLTYERIGVALGTAKTHVSDMIKVSRVLPDFVIDAIGRAPTLGAPRWKQLAESIEEAGASAVKTCKTVVRGEIFAASDAETRFRAFAAALAGCADEAASKRAPRQDMVSDQDGVVFAAARRRANGVLTLDISKDADLAFRGDGVSFSDWLMVRMQSLREQWKRNE
jgi:ParB family chromosome partitioning protein